MGRGYGKKDRYQGKRRSKGIRWYWWLLGFALWLGWMMLSFRPEFQPLRDTLAWKLVGKLACSGVLLYFAWAAKGHPPRPGQIIMTLMAAVFWQSLLIPSARLLLAHTTVLVFAGAGYLIRMMILEKKSNQPLMLACMFFGLMLLDFMGDYVYVDGNDMRHWQLSLVLGAATGAAACWLMYHGFIQLKDDRMSEKICWCVMAVFVGFFLVWSTANNLNYMLDTSEPEHFDARIVDKEIDSSGKTTDYEITVVLDEEEVTFDVSQSVYFHYEVGQFLPVELYQGFFNDPYYIHE